MPQERLVLIPGMGADGRLFEPQRRHGFHFDIPVLTEPNRRDTLATYAERIREQLDLTAPCVVGGVSFGGMLACELARVCGARCAILIASCRNRSGVPSHYRVLEVISRVIPDGIIQRRAVVSGRVFAALECITEEQKQTVMQMSRDVAVPQLRRIARMLLQWNAPEEWPFPIHQIHGDADRIIPLKRVEPDEVVAGGGHLINMTHAEQVNAFIERHLFQGSVTGSAGHPEEWRVAGSG